MMQMHEPYCNEIPCDNRVITSLMTSGSNKVEHASFDTSGCMNVMHTINSFIFEINFQSNVVGVDSQTCN